MFDSLAIAAIRDELAGFIGARVQRIVQSDPLTLGLELYALHQRRWLLATADASRAGLWFVAHRIGQSPDPPSPITLLMRKWLRGARLEAVVQPAFERLLRLRFATRFEEDQDSPRGDEPEPPDDNGAATRSLDLIVEATGRLGNVILVDENGLILDAIKRVPPSINRHRTILPRRPYVGPPPQAKAAPDELTVDLLRESLAGSDALAANVLLGIVRGVSPLAAREAVHRASGRPDAKARDVDPSRLAGAIHELTAPLRAESAALWHPSVGLDEERIAAFAPYQLTHLPRFDPTPTLSAAAEHFFGQPAGRSPLAQAQASLRGELESRRARESRRLGSIEHELAGAADVDTLRESGDLIYAYASQIAPGTDLFEVDGRRIALDPTLSPIENGQAYFERYTRLRDARRRLPALIDEAHARVAYLDETLLHLGLARTPEEVSALRAEMHEPDEAVPIRLVKGKTPPKKRAEPLRIKLDGHTLYVGRSAKQNEVATFELARPGDLWLHARGVAGGHVILRVEGARPDQRLIERAAAIAAFHSESRAAGRVPVDVADRRHVRKIKGAPGAVTYSGERTLTVVPKPADQA